MSADYRGTYRRMGLGVERLAKIVGDGNLMLVGYDGAVLGHLMRHYFKKNGMDRDVDLDARTVQMSSHHGEFDDYKFSKLLKLARGEPTYAVDVRTKTGGLTKTIRDKAVKWNRENFRNPNLKVVIMFDGTGLSDYCVYNEELTDDERILWHPDMGPINSAISRRGAGWKYSLSHDVIASNPHVDRIKKFV